MERKNEGTSAEMDKALELVRPAVRGTPGYVPGIQPKPGQKLVKLNTNENPYPPSPHVIEAIREAAGDTLRLYPSSNSDILRQEAASLYGLDPEGILCGNGSDEVLSLIMRTFIGEGDAVAYFTPSYSLYPVLAAISSAKTVVIPLPRTVEGLPVPSPGAKVFFLSTPNSPYGFSFPTSWIGELLTRFKGIVVADEAYVDFAPESSLPLLRDNPRLIIVRTLSKTFSLAGMRIGFAFGHPALIREIRKVKDSYNVSRLAQAAGAAALRDREYLARTRDRIIATRTSFAKTLARLGFSVPRSDANFLFAAVPAGMDAKSLYERLLSRGFLVRWFTHAEISDGLRISIGTEEDMKGLAKALEEECHGR